MHDSIHFCVQRIADVDWYVGFQIEHTLYAANIGCAEVDEVFHLHHEEFAVHNRCNVKYSPLRMSTKKHLCS